MPPRLCPRRSPSRPFRSRPLWFLPPVVALDTCTRPLPGGGGGGLFFGTGAFADGGGRGGFARSSGRQATALAFKPFLSESLILLVCTGAAGGAAGLSSKFIWTLGAFGGGGLGSRLGSCLFFFFKMFAYCCATVLISLRSSDSINWLTAASMDCIVALSFG